MLDFNGKELKVGQKVYVPIPYNTSTSRMAKGIIENTITDTKSGIKRQTPLIAIKITDCAFGDYYYGRGLFKTQLDENLVIYEDIK